MLGLFSLFGRSPDLKALDQAFHDAGLHPRAVPEAVKLTTVRLLKTGAGRSASLPQPAYDDAALLLAYCIQGRDQFIASNGLPAADDAESRLDAAIAGGDTPDAKLVLLALHAGLIRPEVADRFEVETG